MQVLTLQHVPNLHCPDPPWACTNPTAYHQSSAAYLCRERQPWEAADGEVYLVRELAPTSHPPVHFQIGIQHGAGSGLFVILSFQSCRERQPWEAADGAVYLVRELAAAAPDTMAQLMPALAEAVRHGHYAHACHLQVSLISLSLALQLWPSM